MASDNATPESAQDAIFKEALRQAVEYHSRLSQSPTTTGAAKATTLTATAEEFVRFLQGAADNAGVKPEDI